MPAPCTAGSRTAGYALYKTNPYAIKLPDPFDLYLTMRELVPPSPTAIPPASGKAGSNIPIERFPDPTAMPAPCTGGPRTQGYALYKTNPYAIILPDPFDPYLATRALVPPSPTAIPPAPGKAGSNIALQPNDPQIFHEYSVCPNRAFSGYNGHPSCVREGRQQHSTAVE